VNKYKAKMRFLLIYVVLSLSGGDGTISTINICSGIYTLKYYWSSCFVMFSLFELNHDAGHIVSTTAVTVRRVNILSNYLVEHIFNNQGVSLIGFAFIDFLF